MDSSTYLGVRDFLCRSSEVGLGGGMSSRSADRRFSLVLAAIVGISSTTFTGSTPLSTLLPFPSVSSVLIGVAGAGSGALGILSSGRNKSSGSCQFGLTWLLKT